MASLYWKPAWSEPMAIFMRTPGKVAACARGSRRSAIISPAALDLEQRHRRCDGGVERLHGCRDGDGEAQGGAREQQGRDAGTFGADGEDESAGELRRVHLVEVDAAARHQRRPARRPRPGSGGERRDFGTAARGAAEVAGQLVGRGADGDRQAEQAASRGAQGARMVGVGGADRRRQTGGAGGLGDARQGAEVAGVLQPLDEQVEPRRPHRQAVDAAARQARHGQQAARRVGVGQRVEQRRLHLDRRRRQARRQRRAGGGGQEGGRRQDGLQRQTGGQRLGHQMRPFEQRVVAFTSAEAANILERPILATCDRHDLRS